MNFQDLSPELKEKARACETAEELAALAAESGVELTKEELEEVSGGSWATECPKEDCDDYGEPKDPGKRMPCYHDGFL